MEAAAEAARTTATRNMAVGIRYRSGQRGSVFAVMVLVTAEAARASRDDDHKFRFGSGAELAEKLHVMCLGSCSAESSLLMLRGFDIR